MKLRSKHSPLLPFTLCLCQPAMAFNVDPIKDKSSPHIFQPVTQMMGGSMSVVLVGEVILGESFWASWSG